MAERPDALALIDAARHTLAEELLPGAAPEQRLPLLMVARALSIASRELAAGDDGPEPLEHALLRATAPDAGDSDDARRRQLCERLRAGGLEPAADAGLRAGLLSLTRARLAVSNPKLLAALDGLYGGASPAPAEDTTR